MTSYRSLFPTGSGNREVPSLEFCDDCRFGCIAFPMGVHIFQHGTGYCGIEC
jgi:hypothetical protein